MKKLLVVAIALPFLYLIYALFVSQVNDPIKYIFTVTGLSGMFLLLATTTASAIKKTKYRKILGLGAFFYSLLHLINFVALDSGFDFALIVEETIDKPFVYLGMLAFLILLFMAFTSSKKGFKKHGKKHKVIYVAIILVLAHFLIGQKAITIDYWWYFLIFLAVLALKIKAFVK